ncbi:MAG TPA: hypothetical protein VMR48_05360 [Gaiellaceae bacterium]|nr:hypothetical protein [Gaiellaceae bacterium]
MVEPPPPPPPPEAAPPPPPPEPGRCPNCGAPHDVYQEYCLECGRRLPGAFAGGRYAEVWRRDSPVWLWAALAALLLVALISGAVVALAATDDEKSSEPATSIPVVSTSPSRTDTVGVVTQPPTITINPPTTTTTSSTTTFSTTTIGTTTFGTTTTGSNVTWPLTKDGFTIVLKSVPTSKGRSQAESAADKARTNGLSQVGILNSSDFSSLNPDYYVTFTGIYDTESQANAGLSNARSRGFPTAYVREVSN